MKIDPKAKKSILVIFAILGGLLFVGIAFFAIISSKQSQPSKPTSSVPDIRTQEMASAAPPNIEGYQEMAIDKSKQDAINAKETGGSFIPDFVPPPEKIEQKPPIEPMPEQVYVTQTTTNNADSLLAERMKRLEELAAAMSTEGYAPITGGESWLANNTSPSPSLPTGQNKTPESQQSKMLVKAGEKAFVQIETAINTDEPSPVYATIISGPATGYKIFGAPKHNPNNTISIEFNRMVLPNGKAIPIVAYAIDPHTGRTAVAGNVNHKIFERFVLPAIAAGVAQYGKIISEQGKQTIVTPTGTVTTTQNLTTQQIREAAMGAGIEKISEALIENSKTKPAVTTERNMGIEIVFVQEVIINE